MPGLRLIVGSFSFVGGLVLIAYHKGVARELDEFERLSRVWGSKGHEYLMWRFISVATGVIFALVGALLLINR